MNRQIGFGTRNDSAATIFNNYIIASAISELERVGVLDLLSDLYKRIQDIAIETNLDVNKVYEVFLHLESLGIISIYQGKLVKLTETGIQLKRNIGFFVWAVRGYGGFFHRLGEWLAPNGSVDWASARNGIGVSIGSFLCNKEFMDQYFWQEFEKLNPKCVADIGCGKGDRLFQIAKKDQKINCIGIDVDSPSIQEANNRSMNDELLGQMKFINQNIFDLDFSIDEADVVLCTLMLHDILNRVPPNDFQKWLKKRFPNVEFLLIIDTMMPDSDIKVNNDIFFNGFSLVHSFMNINLRSITEYKTMFDANGLSLIKHLEIPGVPNTHLFTVKCHE